MIKFYYGIGGVNLNLFEVGTVVLKYNEDEANISAAVCGLLDEPPKLLADNLTFVISNAHP
jgi:hypothetical protein